MGILFTHAPGDGDEPWMHARPDTARAQRIFAEMDERIGYQPPGKDEYHVHPLVSYLLKAGVTAGLAVGLTFWITTKVDAQLEENAKLQRASIEMQQSHAAMTTMMAEQATRTERLMGQLVALEAVACGRSAKTLSEARQCQQAASQ